MLILIGAVLCLAAASLLLLPLMLRRRDLYQQYSGSRAVTCPENHQPAAVDIDARLAATTGMDRSPDLRLCDCTRWPERVRCNQACIAQAVHAGPYQPAEGKAGPKQIYHLPILLAAFAAWYVGAIWHSHYLFRSRWMEAVGLTRAEVKQMVWWIWPHLLTAAICLLFAYGVAWLLALAHRKGVLQGILMSAVLCASIAVASGYGLAKLPHNLLMIEAGYALLATLTVGAILGGLYDKLVLPPD